MTEQEITVSVCTGSTCYTQGRTTLNELLKIVPEKYGNNIKVVGTPCLEVCSIDWEHSKSPYVKVGEELISSATTEKVLAEIERQLSTEEQD